MWITWEFDHEMEMHNGRSLDFTMMIRVAHAAPWPPQVFSPCGYDLSSVMGWSKPAMDIQIQLIFRIHVMFAGDHHSQRIHFATGTPFFSVFKILRWFQDFIAANTSLELLPCVYQ